MRGRVAPVVVGVLIAGCGDGPFAPASQAGLGIYSETEQRLRPDRDVFIGTFSGGGAEFALQRDTRVRDEGAESLRSTVRTTGEGYAGWFVTWGTRSRAGDDAWTRDMSAYAGGSLRLSARATVELEVGIRSGNIRPGEESSRVLLSRSTRFIPGTGWQRLCIPLEQLAGPEPLADLSRIKVLFVVAVSRATGGTAGAQVSFWIDDVRWDTHPC